MIEVMNKLMANKVFLTILMMLLLDGFVHNPSCNPVVSIWYSKKNSGKSDGCFRICRLGVRQTFTSATRGWGCCIKKVAIKD